MSSRVTVVDYGLSNLFSIRRALEYGGAEVAFTSTPDGVVEAERLIVPGVGAFGDGMRQLRQQGLVEPIIELASSGRPLLGICLGMQLLFSESEEFGLHPGLDLIPGRVVRLRGWDPEGRRVKVPHVGWSPLIPATPEEEWGSTILASLAPGDSMYFVHSYAPRPENDDVGLANILYGEYQYCAAVQSGNVIGLQCHPEKSGEVGLMVLQDFLRWSS